MSTVSKINSLLSVVIALLLLIPGIYFLQAKNVNYVSNREPLADNPYIALPFGCIEPQGWIRHQLELAARGMTGNLDELWIDVGPTNGWLGGEGDAWERGPYWLDGLVPLAYILNDQKLIDKAQKWIEWSLQSQHENGYFGPVPDTTKKFDDSPRQQRWAWQERAKEDWWPHMVMLKVLQSYYEATADQRVIDLMSRYFRYQMNHIQEKPLDHWTHWAKSRGGENLASIYWLYNLTGEIWLLDLGKIIFEQTLDWTGRFESTNMYQWDWHGVNTAMGIKQPAIWYQFSKDDRYLKAVRRGIDELMHYHGQVYGLWAADELLAGKDPTKGTETCTVVEYMFSLESVLKISGDPFYGDVLERVAFNALPACLERDHTGRQYYQMANQVVCNREWHNFSTKHGDTENLFGFETGYGCCTANYHQGWPKLVKHLWMASSDNGLAAMIYAPSRVTARVCDGVQVVFREETDYPFKDRVRFIYEKGKNVQFPFHLRIPQWCDSATVFVNGTIFKKPAAGSIIKLVRRWQQGDVIELHLPMNTRCEYGHERSASIERGPLVFALGLEEKWQTIAGDEPHTDNEVYPENDWNYGLLRPNLENPDSGFKIELRKVENMPWSLENAPVKLITTAKKMPEWQLYGGIAGPVPYSPYWRPKKYDTTEEKIILVPYGCTKLRIANFPVIR